MEVSNPTGDGEHAQHYGVHVALGDPDHPKQGLPLTKGTEDEFTFDDRITAETVAEAARVAPLTVLPEDKAERLRDDDRLSGHADTWVTVSVQQHTNHAAVHDSR